MKKTIALLSLCLFLLMGVDANAQKMNEWLKTKKEEAKAKINNKVDQKTSAGIDNALNKPEDIIKKKKEKNKEDKEKKKVKYEDGTTTKTVVKEKDGENKQAVTNAVSMDGEGAQTVIQTNIFCAAGKTKIESMLKKKEGIFEVKTNIQNGEVAIRYSSDGTTYNELLKLINQQGFEADGNKPTAGAPGNPCKK